MAAIDNGALEFDVVMNNGKLTEAIEDAQKKIQGFTDTTTKSGEKLDGMFDITADNIKIQKKVVKDLEDQIKELNKEIDKLSPGRAQNELRRQASAAQKELQGEKDALRMMEDQMKTTEKSSVNFRTRIRQLRDELVMMEAAGKRNTKEYEDLRMEMANLVDAVGDATAQANILAHDQAAMQGIISGLSGITGGFTAAQGAMSLFVGENEDLQKVMLKVQSLMSITIGLQQVEQTLNKDSAFMVKTVGDLKRWWTGVQEAATAATAANTTATAANTAAATAGAVANTGLAGSFRLVAAAIKSIPVFGWIAAAIGAIIGAVALFGNKSEKAKEEADAAREAAKKAAEEKKAAMDELAKSYAEQRTEIEGLRASLYSEKLSYDEKVKVINKLREIIPDYNVKLSKEGKVLAENKKALDDYLLSLDKSLRYKAALGELTKIYKDIYEMDRKGFGPEFTWVPGANKMSFGEYSAARMKQMGLKPGEHAGGAVLNMIQNEYNEIQKVISQQKKAYDDLLKSAEDVKKYISDNSLVSLAVVESGGGGGGTGTGGGNTVNTFVAGLEKMKKAYEQYEKWANSTDPVLQKAAKEEFADLLKQGSSYLDYLKNQRDELMKIGERTQTQNDHLKDLNVAIADETTTTIIGSFEKALDTQLSKADNVIEKLSIIQEKRKEMEESGDSEIVQEGKEKVLADAENDATKQAQDELKEIMTSYRMSVDYRLNAENEYQAKMSLLRNAFAKETDENAQKELGKAMEVLTKMHAAGIESFEDLDMLNREAVSQLEDFESKRLSIVNYYEPLIAAARIRGDEDTAKKLEGKRDLEINAETEEYKRFFGDVQNMSIRAFESTRKALTAMIESAYHAGKITYEQYKMMIEKIDHQVDQAYKGRGIEALFGSGKTGGVMNLLFGEGDLTSKIEAFKTIFNKPKEDSDKIEKSTARTMSIIEAVGGGVAAIMGSTVDAMNTIADLEESFGKDASGLRDVADMISATNDAIFGGLNKLKNGDVIGGAIDTILAPAKIFTMANKIHDRHNERQIRRHQRAVQDLANAYNQLSWQIDKALGKDVYSYQRSAIHNMEEQQKHIREMIRQEEGKKDTDHDRIKEFQEQIKELERQKEDMLAEIARDITQTDAKTFADQLGDALVEAFGKGESAAKAFDKTVNDILRNAVMNMLKKQFLEKGLQKALDKLQGYMGFWNGDEFVFDGLSDDEMQSFKNQVSGVAREFSEAMKVYEELFKDTIENEDKALTGTGGIESVTEDTASKIDGQVNAIRINQIESIQVMREQLKYLAQIEFNTSFCKYAARLESIYNILIQNQSSSLRGRGLS